MGSSNTGFSISNIRINSRYETRECAYTMFNSACICLDTIFCTGNYQTWKKCWNVLFVIAIPFKQLPNIARFMYSIVCYCTTLVYNFLKTSVSSTIKIKFLRRRPCVYLHVLFDLLLKIIEIIINKTFITNCS